MVEEWRATITSFTVLGAVSTSEARAIALFAEARAAHIRHRNITFRAISDALVLEQVPHVCVRSLWVARRALVLVVDAAEARILALAADVGRRDEETLRALLEASVRKHLSEGVSF